jgi:hypothetical protein
MRNRSGSKGLIQKAKESVSSGWHGSVLRIPLGIGQQPCCNKVQHKFVIQHSQVMIVLNCH